MKKALRTALALLLCMSALCAISAASADSLADAFEGSGRIVLEETTLEYLPDPEVLEDSPVQFLDLSPDGKTMLCTQADWTADGHLSGFHLSLIRDREIIPVTANAGRGDGDPYGKLETIGELLLGLPGSEGISWSTDGRYCTFSNVRIWIDGYRAASLDIPVVDTLTAEMWLADSWESKDRTEDGCAVVLLSKMSQSGEHVYYLIYDREDGQWYLDFCRCAAEGGSREILCRMPRDERALFEPTTVSDMAECADGSWLVLGTTGSAQEGSQNTALLRLAPGRGGWTAEVLPTKIPQPFRTGGFRYSAASGTGLMLMAFVYNSNSVMGGVDYAIVGMANRVNLIRVRPAEAFLYSVWHMKWRDDASGDLVMVRGEPYLQYFQALVFGRTDPGIPAEYNVETDLAHPAPVILNACISPDGSYALLYARETMPPNPESDRFYLLSLETMEIRPVEAPDRVTGLQLTAGTALGGKYKPAMVWHADGTLVILTADDGIGFFRLTVR